MSLTVCRNTGKSQKSMADSTVYPRLMDLFVPLNSPHPPARLTDEMQTWIFQLFRSQILIHSLQSLRENKSREMRSIKPGVGPYEKLECILLTVHSSPWP